MNGPLTGAQEREANARAPRNPSRGPVKSAIVIGGATGIGFACAEALALQGASVVLCGRREDRLMQAAGQLGAEGERKGQVSYATADAMDEVALAGAFERAAEQMGGIDTVVLSAGISGVTPIASTSAADFKRICDANLLPAFIACKLGSRWLAPARGGAITLISSIYGLVGQRERAAYCAAKSGVIGLARSAALDLAGDGIRVNAICPGFIETELSLRTAAEEPDPEAALAQRRLMHPIPRAGRPEEIGALAAYLSSDAAAWITGQALPVDGGYTAR